VICLDLPEDPQGLGGFPSPIPSNVGSRAKIEPFHATATENKARYFYYSVNVTDSSQVSKVVKMAVKELRYPLQGIVTTAGSSGEIDALDYPPEDFRRLLDINIMGTFLVVQAAARVMREQKSAGSVVLIASMSGSVANKVRQLVHNKECSAS